MRLPTLPFAAIAGAALLASSPFPAAFAEQVKLVRVPDRGIQPQVAVDGAGVVHLIYFRGEAAHGDVFYARSADEGATFSRPLRVNSERGSAIAIGNIRGAHLALGKNDRIHVAWTGSGHKGHANAEMLHARLNDAGTAFEPQRNVIGACKFCEGGSVAADRSGNVYVVWHAPAPGGKGEADRRVWVARSTDEGKTFSHEKAANEKPTGACGCCGLNAFTDHKGRVYLLYRAAAEQVNRDTYLLTSGDRGASFRSYDLHPWKLDACPMCSYAFAEGPAGVLAAWETKGQVYYSRVDPATGKASEPVSAPGESGDRKHPVVACDRQGQTILVWTEGMGWNRGGAVAWQVFDRDGKPTAHKGRADGVATWGLVAVFARRKGGFTILY
jgi:hypothetical protein